MEPRKIWIVLKRDTNKKQEEMTFEDVREAYDYILDELVGNLNLAYIELYMGTRYG
jgi:hypothetical protein